MQHGLGWPQPERRLKAPHRDELKADRLQLDIPVILPNLPDEADACVELLVDELEDRDGIDWVHVFPASGDQPAKLCIHYHLEVLSLEWIKEIAAGAGAHPRIVIDLGLIPLYRDRRH
ncbi:MAG: hypothetical protein NTU78_16425 [Alphaproteobacteria bacterium]|nr:hypothetical protein [Alphaproteobacteria bacterium]